MSLIFRPFIALLLFIISYQSSLAQSERIIESTEDHILFEVNFDHSYMIVDTLIGGGKFQLIRGNEDYYRNPGDPWLPAFNFNIGIPHSADVNLKVLRDEKTIINNKFILPYPENDPVFVKYDADKINKEIYSKNQYFPASVIQLQPSYIFRFSRILPVRISPYQFNPVTRELLFHKMITFRIDFNAKNFSMLAVKDPMTEETLNKIVVNYDVAKNFIAKVISGDSPVIDSSSWYDPNKNYFKIYLKEKGVYKLNFEYLVSKGVPIMGGVPTNSLAIYHNGEMIPIEVNDGGDQVFNDGDIIRFVGYPPDPTPYAKQNIYNIDNVYWLTYQADSTNFYANKNGFPINLYGALTNNYNTKHYEFDKIYERLGHAQDDHRDYWYWDKAESQNFMPSKIFVHYIGSLDTFANRSGLMPQATVRVGVHGMTSASCNYGHSAFVSLNAQKITTFKWNGQEQAVIEKDFLFSYFTNSEDSIRLYWTANNKFEVGCDGAVCTPDGIDNIRINWFEIDYWRWNKVEDIHYIFKSPPSGSGRFLYYLWRWNASDMKIFIPERGELINNPYVRNDNDKSVLFEDTVSTGRTEYFCVSADYTLLPDSIIKDISSDLTNNTNGADYIIITHPQFMTVAEQLAQFRTDNLPNMSSARVKIVDVTDINDQFSYGLLDPYALNKFVKNAFENWQSPAPSYIVLLGDMSWDYRHKYIGSQLNYVASIPYHAFTYGQAASDNLIVAVSGDDIVPDLTIGRLSCETVEEGNVLVDKIMNYPLDTGKKWKQDILLMSSGIDADDENTFHFNDANVYLETNYIARAGFGTSKVFRYPNIPEYEPFQGEGPRIREEFDEGTILANYYGHGGGGQWDFVFTNDDIYELQNGGRLPFISSVTCYTAHFDNQDVFGEKFNKVEGKGSIGFFGSSGLTYWGIGKSINQYMFNEIFIDTVYTVGKAILSAKLLVPSSGLYGTQIALLTLLGDPAIELALPKHPDFVLETQSLSFEPREPIKGDTVNINIAIQNLGRSFPGDSIILNLYNGLVSTNTLIDQKKLGSFREVDTVTMRWAPNEGGVYNLIAQVNIVDPISEEDFTDNSTSSQLIIYDFDKPYIVKPVDGYFTQGNKIDFRICDIGYIFNRNFSYLIQIDTVFSIDSPVRIESPILNPENGVVNWSSPVLSQGEYFWRSIIYDDMDTNKSDIRIFSIAEENGNGFMIKGKELQLLHKQGVDYSDSLESLVMNFDLLPPRPSNDTYLDSILVELYPDANGMTTFTTDGTYFYYGHLPYYTQGAATAIYKVGTGFNGTVKGQSYGKIPNINLILKNQIFCHSDGYVYAALGNIKRLLKIDPITGDTSTVFLADSLLPSYDGLLENGGFYLISDGNYVYNLSAGFGAFRNEYTMRTFDPANGWQKVGDDIHFSGMSAPGFSGFIVVDGYLLTFESLDEGLMRRHRLSDGIFEEEWHSYVPLIDLYTISYDWVHDYVYFSTFLPLNLPYTPAFHQFDGTFKNSRGFISSGEIGPSRDWQNLKFKFDLTGSTGYYETTLYGKNRATTGWEQLMTDLDTLTNLSGINASIYSHLKIEFILHDSLGGQTNPIKFNGIKINYTYVPELYVPKQSFTFSTNDTLLQGFPIDMNIAIKNIGYTGADSILVRYYLEDNDTLNQFVINSLEPDSAKTFSYTINTSKLLRESPVTKNNVIVKVETPIEENFYFNNLSDNSFYISRDSLRPAFSVTFDGREIINGDIISARPDVRIILEDNSPLPLDTSYFTIVYDDTLLYFARSDLSYNYTPYPNSKAEIHWTPEIKKDGEHTLQVLAKDASGNFFDSTSYRITFNVFNESDVVDLFNYPNPFIQETYFTFSMQGTELPEEVRIKVFTIAGRLIREINIPPNNLIIGFNKIYWNGRDEDGDEIGNGVYLYKLIAKFPDKTKSITQKLARVR